MLSSLSLGCPLPIPPVAQEASGWREYILLLQSILGDARPQLPVHPPAVPITPPAASLGSGREDTWAFSFLWLPTSHLFLLKVRQEAMCKTLPGPV